MIGSTQESCGRRVDHGPFSCYHASHVLYQEDVYLLTMKLGTCGQSLISPVPELLLSFIFISVINI